MINDCFYPIFLTKNHWKNTFQKTIRFKKNLQGSKTPKMRFFLITNIFNCRIQQQHEWLRNRQKRIHNLPRQNPYFRFLRDNTTAKATTIPTINRSQDRRNFESKSYEGNERKLQNDLDTSNSYQE